MGAFHLGEDRTDEVGAVGDEGGFGENEEEARVGEGVVLEIWGNGGAESEEGEGEGRVV